MSPSKRTVIIAAGGAFLLKLSLALFTYGSNDVRTWEYDLAALRTAGFAELYRTGVQYRPPSGAPSGAMSQRQAFIHPPAILHMLPILGSRFWLRVICAVADAGTLAVLWSMSERRGLLLAAL